MSNTTENKELEELVRRQLELIGEDPEREGLIRTPARVAKAMKFLTQGYDTSAEEVIGKGVFKEEHDNMIMVRDIELYSLCEHHMLPFLDRKSTRLNSSHSQTSYAVFCLKKKK